MIESKQIQAEKVIASAYFALKQGDINEATKLAQQARQLAPEKEETWLLLAYLAEPEEGLRYVQEALKIRPTSKRARQAIHYLLKKNLSCKSALPDVSASSPTTKTSVQQEIYQQPLDEKLIEEIGNSMEKEPIQEETVLPEKQKEETDSYTFASVPAIEPKPIQSEAEQTQVEANATMQNVDTPKGVNEPELKAVSAQPDKKIEGFLETRAEKQVVGNIEEPETEERSFTPHNESLLIWEIDPVIVCLILLGITVVAITITVILKYHLILP